MLGGTATPRIPHDSRRLHLRGEVAECIPQVPKRPDPGDMLGPVQIDDRSSDRIIPGPMIWVPERGIVEAAKDRIYEGCVGVDHVL